MTFFDVPNWIPKFNLEHQNKVTGFENSCCDEYAGISKCDKVLKVKFIIIYYCFLGWEIQHFCSW